jgi:hypothetical protein
MAVVGCMPSVRGGLGALQLMPCHTAPLSQAHMSAAATMLDDLYICDAHATFCACEES